MPDNLETLTRDDSPARTPDGDSEGEDLGADESHDDHVHDDESADIELVSSSVSELATPYSISVHVEKAILDKKLLAYFNKNKAKYERQLYSIANTKGAYPENVRKSAIGIIKGFRKGKIPRTTYENFFGKKNVYAAVWEAVLHLAVKNQNTGKEVLLFEDSQIRESETHYVLDARFYFIPSVTLPEDFDPADIDATVVVRTEAEIEQMVDRRIEEVMKTALLPEKKTGPVELGDGALVSIVAQKDNKPYAPATIKHHTLYTGDVAWDSPFKPFANILLGHSAGDRFVTDPIAWGPDILVQLNVVVHQVFSVRKLPPEEFVQAKGFESVENWQGSIRKEFKDTEASQGRRAVSLAVERKLQEIAEVGPIPNAWVASRTNDQYQGLVMQHGGDEKQILARFGRGDRQEVYQILAGQISYDLQRQLLIRAYAAKIGMNGPDSMHSVDSTFTDSVWAWAEQNIRVDRVTTEVLRQRRAAAQADVPPDPVQMT